MTWLLPPTDAFVDESIRGQRYLMSCVMLAARDIASTRATIADLSIAHRRVHFHNESPKRRAALLMSFADLPISTQVVVCRRRRGVTEFNARAACLTAIVEMLQRVEVARVVIESRQDDRSDVGVIERVRKREPPLVFEHRRGVEEPLLWLADGITWAVGAGGRWREIVSPIVAGISTIEP